MRSYIYYIIENIYIAGILYAALDSLLSSNMQNYLKEINLVNMLNKLEI